LPPTPYWVSHRRGKRVIRNRPFNPVAVLKNGIRCANWCTYARDNSGIITQPPHFNLIATTARAKYNRFRPYGKNICVADNGGVCVNPVILFDPNKITVIINVNIAVM